MALIQSDTIPLAIVTGAARRIGRLIALHLAHKGFAIGLHYFTSESEAESTAGEIRNCGVPVFLLKADLTDSQEIEDLFNRLDKIHHPLRVLINSAAIMQESDLMKITPGEWDKVISLNLRSVWLTSREAARRMQTGGSIINLSDVGAHKNWTRYGAYAISKSAVETLTRTLAVQLAPGIRVNAIAPGLVMRDGKTSEELWQVLVKKVPMNRQADTNQLLETLDFLLSNEYITGEIITLAGGYQLV